MNQKSLTPVGALHPILFCAGIYLVALFFSIFICSSIFYVINNQGNNGKEKVASLSSKNYEGTLNEGKIKASVFANITR
ncbi:MAG TPA: hypothetical protein VIK74_02715 [Parasegetibacter sp.]